MDLGTAWRHDTPVQLRLGERQRRAGRPSNVVDFCGFVFYLDPCVILIDNREIQVAYIGAWMVQISWNTNSQEENGWLFKRCSFRARKNKSCYSTS